MNYDVKYLERRRSEVDCTEWLDILYALKAMHVPRNARIVELGAGEGGLLRFLVKHGYRNVIGYDLLYEDDLVVRADLTKVLPEPPFDVCISQHFLEHIPQDRAIELAKWCLSHGLLFIAIVPGHHNKDPTHIVNHYEYEDLLSFVKKVNAPYWRIEPDMMSFVNPAARDWLVVLSRKPIPRKVKPFWFTTLIRMIRTVFKLLGRVI